MTASSEPTVAAATAPGGESTAVSDALYEPLPAPVQGAADWRRYRCLRLRNGVTVCLVHDAMAKTTAAAATVNAGAGSDPRTLSGLAHFCEHMVFLGSEKYPAENAYKHYLASHGGQSNASTSLHTTTFKFEVLAAHAEGALDRFAQFFVAPLFTASGTGREVQAVDSEDARNRAGDARRRLQVLKALGATGADGGSGAAPRVGHYYTKFTTGNNRTLPAADPAQTAAVREALLEFHAFHYRPDNLTVVVAGPQSLEELEEWVVPRFAPMVARDGPYRGAPSSLSETQRLIRAAAAEAPPHGHAQPPAAFASAFPRDHPVPWPFAYTVRPLKGLRLLALLWPLPPVGKDLDRSPVAVLSHLLGHEGPGSAFGVLQAEGLASSLSAGPRHAGPNFALMQVSLGLTPQGEEHWQRVVDVVLQHVRLIHGKCLEAKAGKPSDLPRIWEESATLGAMFFNQNSPGGVYDFCPALAGRIVTEGTEKCLSAGSMLNETADSFPLDRVTEFVTHMVDPTNCFIERCSLKAADEMEQLEQLSQDISPTTRVVRLTEPWYDIDFFVSGIDKASVEAWSGTGAPLLDVSSRLHLPTPNRFIPRTLALCDELPDEAKAGPRIERPIDPPNLLGDDLTTGRLWHRLDDRYALPKSVITCLVRTASVDHVKVDGAWQRSVWSSVCSSMLAGIFSEAMAVDTYDAHLAGLNWNVGFSSSGITFTCSGFSDRLPDLALEILQAYMRGDFITESYFTSTKDRVCRDLKTYFQSRRADATALYYRDLLLVSNNEGINASLTVAEAVTLDDVKEHHAAIFRNPEWMVDCLVTGNVSSGEAKAFFSAASAKLSTVFTASTRASGNPMWFPGETERRIPAGEDIEFHFTSQNMSDENGAVVMTYQSPIPGYRGEVLSTPESLKASACLRLISHILREPLFDELRTKQTLGYVVSSWFDVGLAGRPPNALLPQTVPVDFLVIAILSRKLSPVDIAQRIEAFLASFRQVLVDLPAAELESYAMGLSTKLRKPIQKLGTEASNHMGKIRSYAPEVFARDLSADAMPWDNAPAVARQIEALQVPDLVAAWDRLVLAAGRRARVTACVYGTTFPLAPAPRLKARPATRRVVDDVAGVLELRRRLAPFDNTPTVPTARAVLRGVLGDLARHRTLVAAGAVAVTAMGVAGWTLLGRASRKSSAKL